MDALLIGAGAHTGQGGRRPRNQLTGHHTAAADHADRFTGLTDSLDDDLPTGHRCAGSEEAANPDDVAEGRFHRRENQLRHRHLPPTSAANSKRVTVGAARRVLTKRDSSDSSGVR
ncbi:hypothetical protein Acy02nite_17830 [Actinoplanes cyaneus]|uniref:Uncharacterized protein n=1 Tax=Actinoplanes cyaneus TaxID=52696 RepID=A0A919IGG0_9ACTN|nr:hypothetical protein Acy02nite_17830 [Actinoplanes cyaneus]